MSFSPIIENVFYQKLRNQTRNLLHAIILASPLHYYVDPANPRKLTEDVCFLSFFFNDTCTSTTSDPIPISNLFYTLLYRYTSKGKEVFAITLSWPRSGKLVLRDPTVTDQTRVTMLGTKRHITWTHGSKHKGGKSGVVIHAPVIPVSDLPCLWAWVFKLSHVK